MHSKSGFRIVPNRPWIEKKRQRSHNLPTWRHRQFFWRYRVSFVKFSYWSKFHVNVITGSTVITTFPFEEMTRTKKSKIPPSEFSPISRDCGKLRIPNLTQMSLMKCSWILQNVRVAAFTLSGLLRDNQLEIKLLAPSPPPLPTPSPPHPD